MALSKRLLTNAGLATFAQNGAPYGLIEDGALAIEDGTIAWVGNGRKPSKGHYANWTS